MRTWPDFQSMLENIEDRWLWGSGAEGLTLRSIEDARLLRLGFEHVGSDPEKWWIRLHDLNRSLERESLHVRELMASRKGRSLAASLLESGSGALRTYTFNARE